MPPRGRRAGRKAQRQRTPALNKDVKREIVKHNRQIKRAEALKNRSNEMIDTLSRVTFTEDEFEQPPLSGPGSIIDKINARKQALRFINESRREEGLAPLPQNVIFNQDMA